MTELASMLTWHSKYPRASEFYVEHGRAVSGAGSLTGAWSAACRSDCNRWRDQGCLGRSQRLTLIVTEPSGCGLELSSGHGMWSGASSFAGCSACSGTF